MTSVDPGADPVRAIRVLEEVIRPLEVWETLGTPDIPMNEVFPGRPGPRSDGALIQAILGRNSTSERLQTLLCEADTIDHQRNLQKLRGRMTDGVPFWVAEFCPPGPEVYTLRQTSDPLFVLEGQLQPDSTLPFPIRPIPDDDWDKLYQSQF